MSPDQRNYLSMARSEQYFDVMRTTLFTFTAIAAISQFGPPGYSAALTMLVIATTCYGIIAGHTALADVESLRADMNQETARSHYGRLLVGRNFRLLKALSAGFLALVGLAELYTVLV